MFPRNGSYEIFCDPSGKTIIDWKCSWNYNKLLNDADAEEKYCVLVDESRTLSQFKCSRKDATDFVGMICRQCRSIRRAVSKPSTETIWITSTSSMASTQTLTLNKSLESTQSLASYELLWSTQPLAPIDQLCLISFSSFSALRSSLRLSRRLCTPICATATRSRSLQAAPHSRRPPKPRIHNCLRLRTKQLFVSRTSTGAQQQLDTAAAMDLPPPSPTARRRTDVRHAGRGPLPGPELIERHWVRRHRREN